MFSNKNIYIIFGGIILVSYIFALIIITTTDQKKIESYEKKEINSFVQSKAVTLEYFFNVLKKDVSNISENRILSLYFLNKALGMSMEYGLKVSINKIDRFLDKFKDSQYIKNSRIFKDIILINKEKNIVSENNRNNLIDLNSLNIESANEASIYIDNKENEVYILKNIFIKEKIVGTLVCFINIEGIFKELVIETEQFVLGSKSKLITQSKQSIDLILKDNKYKKIDIIDTPFVIFGKTSDINEKSFFTKWLNIFLAFLAFPILYILYHLLLLNNKNIKLKEEIKNSLKEKQNEKIMLQQSRVAAIGEMIGNIAHQWRQPLSVITTQATGLKISLEYGNEISKDELKKMMEKINNQAQHLSKTIDDFRSFFQGNINELHEFDIRNTLDDVRKLTKDTFNNNFIEYHNNIEDCKIKGNENILIQAFINIYNNAKDALSEKTLIEKYFFVESKVIDDELIVIFKDNANGISKDIIEKVFEPYFTTKHESVGTGIGLYMTNQIITKHFKGSIEVENEEFIFNNKKYTGAKFTIVLPIREF